MVQLRRQAGVSVLEGRVCLGIHLLHQLGDSRLQTCMVAVVRANHLNLIDAHGRIWIGVPRG